MNWDAVMQAYPSQTDEIRGVRSLREKIDHALDAVEIPEIKTTCRELADLTGFASLIAPACVTVWREVTGSDPDFDMGKALASAAFGDEDDAIQDPGSDLLRSVAQNAFSRLLHLLRQRNTHLMPESWPGGDCPFCGTYPRIGFDAEDKRTLHCLSCGHAWRFPRLKCPRCNNADFNTQGYFEAEGVAGVRVSFCRECNHYFKIVDTKVRSADDPETEDALTMELDDLAQKEGFL
jgi:Zn ribbon nucleic-acid-binding protein